MRFIVDLYRVIILVALGLILIGGTFVLVRVTRESSLEGVAALSIGIGAGVAVTVVLVIGLIATFVSIHDRLADLARNASRIADALENAALDRDQ